MKRATIKLPHSFSGTMEKSDEGAFPKYNNIKLKLSISHDTRIRDIEKLFGELQDMILMWNREVDTDCKYIYEGG